MTAYSDHKVKDYEGEKRKRSLMIHLAGCIRGYLRHSTFEPNQNTFFVGDGLCQGCLSLLQPCLGIGRPERNVGTGRGYHTQFCN